MRSLRNGRGGPALRTRVLAALVAVGLLALAAPTLLPVVRWLLGALL